jgi:spoIIIJ-associated protein
MDDGDDTDESTEAGAAVAAGDGEDDEDREDRRRGRRRGRRGGRGRRRNGADGDEPESPVAEADAGEEQEDYADFDEEGEEDEERRDDGPPAERDAEAEQLVGELLDYFLGAMGVVAETFVRDETDNGSLVFEIEGEDAGLLIGRRGETLQALQFLTRLIVNRQLGRKAYMMIDIEGYRERRYDMLRRLARRTAGRVASSGRPAALDPMSPGERRIVHLSLSRHPRVRTESEGEGSRRHVVIRPKR